MNKKDEAEKKTILEIMWLNYFNEYLFNAGVISEEEKTKIANKISKR